MDGGDFLKHRRLENDFQLEGGKLRSTPIVFFEPLEGLPGEHAEENREDKRTGEHENRHCAGDGDEDGDPQCDFDTFRAEQSVEHLSAVQGKDRKEVEQGPEKTDVNEDDEKIAAVLIDRRRDFHDSEDEQAKQDLDGWTRGGDEETLFAIQPDAAEGRISAEGL